MTPRQRQLIELTAREIVEREYLAWRMTGDGKHLELANRAIFALDCVLLVEDETKKIFEEESEEEEFYEDPEPHPPHPGERWMRSFFRA